MLQNGFLGAFWHEFIAWLWECFKVVSWQPSGTIFWPGAGNAFWPELLAWPWKCFKIVSWEFSGANCWRGSRKCFKIASCSAFGREFRAWAWEFKVTSWEVSGANFWPGLGNASKWLPGNLLARISGLGMEMLENGFLGIFWREFLAWAWTCCKMASWEPSGANF